MYLFGTLQKPSLGGYMPKGVESRKGGKKKAVLTLKEKRQRKFEKKHKRDFPEPIALS